MIRVTRHGKVLHIETDIGSISVHDEVLRSGNPSFETRILCYLADYLEKQATAAQEAGTVEVIGRTYLLRDVTAALAKAGHAPVATAPVPMLLFCPKCSTQHIDAPDERTEGWDNPPHRSHLCLACGCIWRPADVPTTGVRSIKTAGKADTWNASTSAAPVIDLAQFREAVEYRYSAELAAFERGCRNENQLEHAESERTRLLTLIDASPKGGSTDAEDTVVYEYRQHYFSNGARGFTWTDCHSITKEQYENRLNNPKPDCELRIRETAMQATTPAAPGIDLEQFRPMMQLGMTWGPGSKYRIAAESLADLIDASPKGVIDQLCAAKRPGCNYPACGCADASPNGGSTDSPVCFISPLDAHMLRSREKTLRWTGTYWEKKHDDMVPVYLGAPTAMQATSAEVGA